MNKPAKNQPSEYVEGRLFDYASLEEAFPTADPGVRPYGDKLLFQMRTPKKKSAGGIILVDETQETELWNTQVAKVVAIGPTAFKNQDTLAAWPEGDWCKVGDYVRVPKWGGDRWQVPIPGRKGEFAMFVVFKELELVGEVTGDPLDIVAYVY
jgi:co-chaperonin GroES (HSP10)